MRAVLWTTVVFLLSITGSTSGAVQDRASAVFGRVSMSGAARAQEPRPAVTALGMSARRPPVEPPRAVVYLDAAPARAFPESDEPHALLDQRGETFVPHVLAVPVGTTVDFRNSDPVYHNVFSLRGPRPFDLGRYATGRSKSVRFDRPGIVRVFCEIHPHMSAFILVFAHSYFAVTGPNGTYQIPSVPPGRYNLVAWSEGSIRQRRTIVVPNDGGLVEADFDLR